MSIKIGIPRGLFYFYYYPLWLKFFELLGAEVILSDRTNKEIVNAGAKNCVDEACLPVKAYHGHVINLKNKVDYLFIPKIMSTQKNEFSCPKLCGISEMIRYSIKDAPPIIDTTINFRNSKKDLHKIVNEIGGYVTQDTEKVQYAFNRALEYYYSYKTLIKKGMLPIDILENEKMIPNNAKKKIMVLGHPYTMYDAHISMNVIEKLRKNDLKVITQDSFKTEDINKKANTMEKKMFWTFGRQILGAGLNAVEEKDVLGIIYLSSFACGIDSVIGDIIERRVRRDTNIPFMLLTVDEHTGEAGVDTRIEAFVDMIRWRGKNESDISTHGKYVSAN